MPNPADIITQAQMDALALLANPKLAPATPYIFHTVDPTIPVPTGIVGKLTYAPSPGNTGYYLPQVMDGKIEIRIYAFKNLGEGKMALSQGFGAGIVLPDLTQNQAQVFWNWNPVAGADGYYITGNRTGAFANPLQYIVAPAPTLFDDSGTGWTLGSKLWCYEFQRLWKDAEIKIIESGTVDVGYGQECLVSSPQVVGINPCPAKPGKLYPGGTGTVRPPDPQWTIGGTYFDSDVVQYNGIWWWLYFVDQPGHPAFINYPPGSSMNPNPDYGWVYGGAEYFPMFKGVEFWCATSDAVGLTVARKLAFPDGTFQTIATSPAAVEASGIDPSGNVSKFVVPDVEPAVIQLQTSSGSTGVDYFEISNPKVKGIWIAKTVPTPANNVFVAMNLPNYFGQGSFDYAFDRLNNADPRRLRTGQTQPAPDESFPIDNVNPVEPSIPSQPALWPVMRDTDDYPWWNNGQQPPVDPYRAVNIITGTFSGALSPLGKNITAYFMPDNMGTWKDWLFDGTFNSDAPLPIYILSTQDPSLFDPMNPGTYDFFKADGKVTLADLIGQYFTSFLGGSLIFIIYNNSAAPVSFIMMDHAEFFDQAGGFIKAPIFYPTNGFSNIPGLEYRDLCESFSFCLNFDALNNKAKLIPQRGHCITNLLIRRTPIESASGILLPPTADEDLPEMEIKIGVLAGTVHTKFEAIQKGTFTPMLTVSMAAGQLEANVNVFWPVIGGTMLVYQADEEMQIQASVNFQPLLFQQQWAQSYDVNFIGVGDPNGNVNPADWSNNAVPDATYNFGKFPLYDDQSSYSDHAALKFINFFDTSKTGLPDNLYFSSEDGLFYSVQFPAGSAQYNDVTNLLNLMI